MITLADIFSSRFYRKTKSTLTDADIQSVIDLYAVHHIKIDDIANLYKANRTVIRKILVHCIEPTALKTAKSIIYSSSVNNIERKKQQVLSWKMNNQSWKSPMLHRDVSRAVAINLILENDSENKREYLLKTGSNFQKLRFIGDVLPSYKSVELCIYTELRRNYVIYKRQDHRTMATH